MSATANSPHQEPEPTWAVARLFPLQGHWTEGSYLSFTESINQLVELVDGHVEVLEMPTKSHQKIVNYLLNVLIAFLRDRKLGDAINAPYRVRMREGTFREPDVTVYLSEHLDRFGDRYGELPDLVVEVVSEDSQSHSRDYDDKRRDYATAGVPEYWIVDPCEQRITVLVRSDDDFVEQGAYSPGELAHSRLLDGFAVEVTSVFQSAEA